MNTVLWIVAAVLAVAFLGAGAMKLTKTREQLQPQMPWVEDASDGMVKGIGAAEALGALGLILLGLTGIAPVLTPIAATGLVVTMIGALITHIRRGEGLAASIPAIVLGLLSAFVAWGRFGSYPL